MPGADTSGTITLQCRSLNAYSGEDDHLVAIDFLVATEADVVATLLRSSGRAIAAQNAAFVESTMNYVVSKRFVKKQQMRWTQRGAHLLLQTRVQVLNGDLRKSFCRWYPKMKLDQTDSVREAA